MVERHGGENCHPSVDHVRTVPRAPHPYLDHGRLDGLVSEVTDGGQGEQLEAGEPFAQLRLDERESTEHLRERVVADGLAVDGDALVDHVEVRARVGPDEQAVLDQDR